MTVATRPEVVDWQEVTLQLERLTASVDRLEVLFPGRKFTLDGHLVGSIGEVVAAYMFRLTLLAGSSQGHDAIAADGRAVEIKFTQGRSVAIRHQPGHLIVLHRPRGGPVGVVYNGPGETVWLHAGAKASNGQRPISLHRLRLLDREVDPAQRLIQHEEPPI